MLLLFILLLFVLMIFIFIWILKSMFSMHKDKKNFLKNNPKFKAGKKLNIAGILNLYICDDGDIAGVFSKNSVEYSIINIKDIRDWDIIQDGESSKSFGKAIAGGILFGGIGLITGAILGGNKQYINNLTLVLKTNNFKNPNIEIVFINTKTSTKDAKPYLNQLQDLTSTLEILAQNNKINNNAAEAV